eukprot:CAMPEP_0180136772 /NCGR_PEP_ID=MMETSP0986-20121125/11739_1 /TAXON_ID=697907 /ORGANISM="non described non described, Strain CCMP2293" /LENGTH=57 /DNA_ID=CAMNT_0022077953 /DNA_START=79 /DNA_END=252 /DNA_ORIENTATION=+
MPIQEDFTFFAAFVGPAESEGRVNLHSAAVLSADTVGSAEDSAHAAPCLWNGSLEEK